MQHKINSLINLLEAININSSIQQNTAINVTNSGSGIGLCSTVTIKEKIENSDVTGIQASLIIQPVIPSEIIEALKKFQENKDPEKNFDKLLDTLSKITPLGTFVVELLKLCFS